VSQNEMVDRLKKLVTMAVDTVVLAGMKFLFSLCFGEYLNTHIK